MGNRQNLSPARNQKTTTKLTPNLQPSRFQSEDFTEKYLRGLIHTLPDRCESTIPVFHDLFDTVD
jgi:hypothetical protein